MSERNYAGCTENEDTIKRLVFEPEHEQLRQTARQYIEREVAPNAEKWERERIVDRSAYVAAGKYGLIGFNMPERYGGGGSDDFRFNAVINEELAKWGSVAPALSLQNDVVGPTSKRWPPTNRRSVGCPASSLGRPSSRSR
ncbi:acyl-CoA dehydrogenase, N-terminal domain protein [Mycobacterium xenopi 3993]|nr:acyl-CoA dehydrogenase, N-terminal domain protein [Mycobacterium xenopi 3993]